MEILEYDKLTIYEVDSLKKALLPVVETLSKDLLLDFSSATKIDMAAIQFLISLKKSCIEKGFNLVLPRLQDSVKDNLRLCACSSLIGGDL
ncbi:STAS domain-containing protein [Sulfurimonas sp.]|nr:STAS domain-containing protein [Sulfurimonas sp.]